VARLTRSRKLRRRSGLLPPGTVTRELLLSLALGYLLGSIPFGLVLTRVAGKGDLRKIGSGNIGATNVLRTGSKPLAALTLILDCLKAAAAILLARELFAGPFDDLAERYAAAGAMIGHLYPVWLKFRGGKGVATGAGIVLGLAPAAFLVALGVWVAVLLLSGYVSLASMVAAVLLPPAVYFLVPERRPLIWLFAALAALILFFHRANIKRLWSGTEHRFGRRASVSS
jgi:glycerol-3-phosphate acyltransferase PlsY